MAVEQISIMGRVVNLRPLGGTDWRTRKRLIEAKARTLLGLRRFSDSENLLYCLAKHDGYLLVTFLVPASAKSIRNAQRQQHRLRPHLPTISLRQILAIAQAESIGLSHDHVSGEHLLLALLRCDPRSEAVLEEGGLSYEKAKRIVTERGIAGYYVNLLGCRPTFWSRKIG
jgi:hypothetical protein